MSLSPFSISRQVLRYLALFPVIISNWRKIDGTVIGEREASDVSAEYPGKVISIPLSQLLRVTLKHVQGPSKAEVKFGHRDAGLHQLGGLAWEVQVEMKPGNIQFKADFVLAMAHKAKFASCCVGKLSSQGNNGSSKSLQRMSVIVFTIPIIFYQTEKNVRPTMTWENTVGTI